MGRGPDRGSSGCSDAGTGLCRQEDATTNAGDIQSEGRALSAL